MKSRCYNPRFAKFKRYGARGIRVCDRWRNDFAAFLADVGERPSLDHSLERKDNDGHYEPDNVVWATRMEQARNKSTNVVLTFRGETLQASEWARRIDIHVSTITYRIRQGWSVERALTTRPSAAPIRPRG